MSSSSEEMKISSSNSNDFHNEMIKKLEKIVTKPKKWKRRGFLERFPTYADAKSNNGNNTPKCYIPPGGEDSVEEASENDEIEENENIE